MGHPTFSQGLVLSVDIIGQMGLLVLLGWFMVRKKWIGQQTLSDLTRLLINGIIPCAFVLSMARSFTIDLLQQGLVMATIIAVWIVGSFIFGRVWFRFLPSGSVSKDRAVTAMLMVQNGIYLPLPVILAVTPPEMHDRATVYISIAALPAIIFMWTTCVILLSGHEKPDMKQRLKLIFNAPLLSLFAGILLTFIPGIQEAARGDVNAFVPLRMIFSVMNYLSLTLSPLAMLILGGFIASSRMTERFRVRHLAPLIGIRLILIPTLVYLLIRSDWLSLPPLAYTVILLVAAAPPATNHALIARQYGGEWELVSSLQLIVHAAALVTMPLWLTIGLQW